MDGVAGPARERVRERDAGFTLIEVIVALTVLTVVATATAYILTTALGTVAANQDRVVAASLARTELERLRVLGAVAITPGLTQTLNAGGTTFTVTTTANWVAVDQPANPCQQNATTTPSRSYMRVHIEAIGGRLKSPQSIDAVVAPRDDVPANSTASITAWVRDQSLAAVQGVSVTASSTATGASSQTARTGFDGCVFFTDLVPGTWTAALSITSPQMMKPSTSSSQTTPALSAGKNSALSFYVSTSVENVNATSGGGNYPLLPGMPLRGSLGTWGSQVPASMPVSGLSVTRSTAGLLWPDPSGYSLKLGCNDAGSDTTFSVTPGGTSNVTLPSVGIEFVGPVGAVVTVKHLAESSPSPCTSAVTATLTLTATPSLPSTLGRARASVPLGAWQASVASTAINPAKGLVLAGTTSSPCLVSWPADPAAPAPGGEVFGSSPSPSSTGPVSDNPTCPVS